MLVNLNVYRSLIYAISILGVLLVSLTRPLAATHTLSNTPVPQAVIFDFGGVLVQSNSKAMFNFVGKQLNLSPAEVRDLFHQRQLLIDRGGDEVDFWQGYFSSIGQTMPQNWIEYCKLGSFQFIPASIQIVKDLKAQGYRVGLLSNVDSLQAQFFRDRGDYDLFEPVLLSYAIGYEKPDPDAFRSLIQTLAIEPAACIFIDDDQLNVDSAKTTGIDSIRFVNPIQLRQELKRKGIHLP